MTNKTVRIITFHSAYSYGAVLQSYALYTFLKNRYSDVKVLNFRNPDISLTRNFKNVKSVLAWYSFHPFLKNIGLTKEVTAEEIRRGQIDNPDVYVIGSDQVWNPNITKSYSDIYFGHFVPDTVDKIAYAVSFGRSDFPADIMNDMLRLIHGFKAISVREESGVELCRNQLGLDAVHVIDPTFLVNNYDERFHLPETRRELCMFILDNNSQDCFECGRTIGRTLGLKVKILNKRKRIHGARTIPFPSVKRFLREIHSSEFVITNSFHGLAFSLIFRKNFIYICTNPGLGSRAENLLKLAGLSNRLFHTYQDASLSDVWMESIDYDEVCNRLNPHIEYSKNFLLDSIGR